MEISFWGSLWWLHSSAWRFSASVPYMPFHTRGSASHIMEGRLRPCTYARSFEGHASPTYHIHLCSFLGWLAVFLVPFHCQVFAKRQGKFPSWTENCLEHLGASCGFASREQGWMEAPVGFFPGTAWYEAKEARQGWRRGKACQWSNIETAVRLLTITDEPPKLPYPSLHGIILVRSVSCYFWSLEERLNFNDVREVHYGFSNFCSEYLTLVSVHWLPPSTTCEHCHSIPVLPLQEIPLLPLVYTHIICLL